MKTPILLLLSLCCLVAGCGGAGAIENDEVTITVTSRGYPEEEILREIYAHALEAAGFEVRRRDEPGHLPWQELEMGLVSGYPEHLDAALIELASAEPENIPGSWEAAWREAKLEFGKKGLVPFVPTSFRRTNVIGMLRESANRRKVAELSNLRALSGAMTAAGGEYYCYCNGRKCLSSLESRYGIVFEGFFVMESPPRLSKALETGEIDAAVFFTTEGALAHRQDRLVLLEDEEHRLPASNAFWLTSQDVIDEAGPDYERTILAAQKGLTLAVMRRLDAEVELKGRSPGEVAAEYLRSKHRQQRSPVDQLALFDLDSFDHDGAL
jgi:glycine betaine/choline ABC-type transport system substrate-binding protein